MSNISESNHYLSRESLILLRRDSIQIYP